MILSTANEARGRWPGILSALGIDPKFLRDIHGPCPMCGGKDRFRFDDKLNGNWICNQCGAGDGFKLLQLFHIWDFKRTAAEVDKVIGTVPEVLTKPQGRSVEDKLAACKKMLESSGRLVEGTPAWAYLTRRCGDLTGISSDLRSHPGIRHTQSGGNHPALLAAMRGPSGTGVSLHRTYLSADGQKADVDPVRKLMPGAELAGSAVRLYKPAEIMGIAEGIETAICARHLFGLPVWAATCANLLASWEPPEIAREIWIFGDNDANYTGHRSAYELANRLVIKGLGAKVCIPEMVQTDWADVFANRHCLERVA